MTIECNSNKTFPTRLTKGKKYDVVRETRFCYYIKDDKGFVNWYGKTVFEVVSYD